MLGLQRQLPAVLYYSYELHELLARKVSISRFDLRAVSGALCHLRSHSNRLSELSDRPSAFH